MSKIIIKPYSWETYNNGNEQELHCWGLNKNSETILLRINFPNFVFIELPFIINNKVFKWENSKYYRELSTFIKENMLKKNIKINIKLDHQKKLYDEHRNQNTYSFMLVSSNNSMFIDKLKTFISKPIKMEDNSKIEIKLKMVEDNFTLDRKFTSIKNIGYTQWIELDEHESITINKVSRVIEYKSIWKDINPIDKNISKGWIINPLILSFDIETYKDKNSTMECSSYPGNYIFQISIVLKRLYDNEKRKISLIYGDYKGELKNTEKYSCKSELELIKTFETFVYNLKPNIIIGFNTHNWDFNYINERLKFNKSNWEKISLLVDYSPNLISIEWYSQSYGENIINYIPLPGIINFDLHKYVKRNYNLQKYGLGFVGKYFIGRGKLEMDAKRMWASVDNYLLSIKSSDKDIIDEGDRLMKEVAEYNVEDSNLVLDLFISLNIWDSLAELSDICGMNMELLYIKGLQYRVSSRIYLECKKKNIIVGKSTYNIDEVEKLVGGYVIEPALGLYEDVIIFDFKSMYPSIVKGYNIDYTTIINNECDEYIDSKNKQIFEWEDDIYNIKDEVIGKDKKKYIYHTKFKGIVPSIMEETLDEREKLKNDIAHCDNEIIKNSLIARQEAIKLFNNSIVGIWGSKRSNISFIEGFETVIHIGRETIKNVKLFLENLGYKVIYGDTDSIMIQVKNIERNKIRDLGMKLQIEINKIFFPLIIEYEKSGLLFILGKKQYIFWQLENNGKYKKETDIIYKGVAPTKKGNCSWIKDAYKKILISILNKQTISETYEIIIDEIIKIYKGDINYKDLIMCNNLGKDYKSENCFMNVFANKLRGCGQTINPGDSLEYIILEDPIKPGKKCKTLLGDKLITPEMYIEDIKCNKTLDIDYKYYIENRLQDCIDDMFKVGYNDIIDDNTYLRIDNECKNKHEEDMYITNNPISDIIFLMKKGKLNLEKLQSIKEKLKNCKLTKINIKT